MYHVGSGKTNIVVTGRSGVGKSILVERIKLADKDWAWEQPERSRDVESHLLRVGRWTRIVRIVPGDTIQERDLGIHEAFSSHHKLEGVVYVVDWGFTRERDQVVREEYITKNGLSTIKDLREFNLNQEREDFAKICDRIQESYTRCRRPNWMFIAVNKADLFVNEINEVQRYYHPRLESPFTDILNKMLDKVGRGNFKVSAAPVCSWQENFEWNGRMHNTEIGGDESARALLKHMLCNLASLCYGKRK